MMHWKEATYRPGEVVAPWVRNFDRAWYLELDGRRFNILIAEKDGEWFIDDTPKSEYDFRKMEGVKNLKQARAVAETIGRIE